VSAVAAGGLLELRFARGGNGATVLVERSQRFPLRLTTPFHLDPAQPGMAFVYVQNPTGGVFGGDRLSLRITAEPGAQVHVTTPSATKVYRAGAAAASQDLTFVVGEGAYVEYVPEPLIPFAGARLEQEVTLEIDEGGSFFGVESVAPGRLARGEELEYERLELWTSAVRGSSELFADALVLEPRSRPPGVRGILGRHRFLATALAVLPEDGLGELAAELDRVATSRQEVTAAACELPSGAGAIVRALASAPGPLRLTVDEAWAAVRRRLLGSPLPPRRK